VILLDTHIWLWWVNGDIRLPVQVRKQLQDVERDGLVVSTVSCWELAYKAASGKLQLDAAPDIWIARALTTPNLRDQPITSAIAVDAAMLPGDFHKDPADRLIVATARVLDIPVVSLDAQINAYPHVKHV
jgi:PIN domain nuclease of toxin-antitoxin system